MATDSPTVRPDASRRELIASLKLGRDVVDWLEDRHGKDLVTYAELADELAELTGVRVTVRTLQNWRTARAERAVA